MARGGKRLGAGRKSFKNATEEQKRKSYENFMKKYYDVRKNKGYEMKNINFDIYEATYNYYSQTGEFKNSAQIKAALVRDFQKITKKQAVAWKKAAEKINFKATQKDFFDSNNAKSIAFWSLIASKGGFKKAVYVDD